MTLTGRCTLPLMRQGGWTRPVVATLALGLAVAACAGGDDDSSTDSDSASDAAEGDAPATGGLGDDIPSGQPMSDEAAQLEDGERAIIYTADLGVKVDDVEAATDAAVTAVEDVGGHLATRHSNYEDEEPTTDLTLKVPPDELDATLEQLEDLGEVYRHDQESDDVTEQMVDLQGRLSSAEASAERLRDMLSGAQTPSDLVEIEGTLTEREANVETLQGQMAALSNQVDLATIDLRVTENPDAVDAAVSDDIPAFLTALRTGWVALVNVVLVLLMIAGFLLPFSPLAVGGWWAYRHYRRSHPARRPAGLIPAPAGGPMPTPESPGSQSPDSEPGDQGHWRPPGRPSD